MIEEQWDEDTNCWTEIEKRVPAENGDMIKTYAYTLINDTIVGFKNWYERKCEKTYQWATQSYLDADLNLPIPFSPGDIVVLDCMPFAPVKPALILEVGDDCCGVWMLFEKDGPLNMDIYKTAALKHGHGFTDFWGNGYYHPLSYLYSLRPYEVPDDHVFENKEWEELQFKTALPQMRKALSEHHFKDAFDVTEDVLRKYYKARCHCIEKQCQ